MNNFIIRTATTTDARQIAEVHVKTWQYAYKGQIPDSYLDSLSVDAREKRWKQMLKDATEEFKVVGELNGRVVGWCTAGKSRDVDKANETGEVYGIYVHPDYIGKGVGSLLMDDVVQKLQKKGFKKATLWVLDTNLKTRNWYERKGWKVEGGTKTDDRGDIKLKETWYIKDL